MAVRKKRVLILTADAGFGHRSAAIALEEALTIRHDKLIDVMVINPLDDKRAPLFLHESQADYDKWVRKAPELYKLGYEASDRMVPSAILESGLTVIMFELMRDLLRKHRPDVVVSTYPLYQHSLTGVLTAFKAKIPIITVVTDLATVHRLWFNNRVDSILVPTEIVRDLAIENGISAEKLHITGIPVHPQISLTDRPKREIRAKLGWEADMFTVLAVGSKRVDGMEDALNVINHFGRPLQLVVVTGKDEEMFADLNAEEWHIPVHLYDFVTNMAEMMHAADLLICKAGGLIVTEALACGLPMILINVIPGQETGNMEFVVNNGAGVWAENPMRVLEAMAHYTTGNQEQLEQAAAAAKHLGKPKAAFDAAEIVWEAAQHTTAGSDLSFRKNIINLLQLNQIPWTEDEPLTSEEPEES